mmetsp:Transcript_22394/g.27362  ORF Transcript_22394/g.27362 Transcript_22394/m.27362 type:complete len:253 (+) Transcript_22394:100-858(+)
MFSSERRVIQHTPRQRKRRKTSFISIATKVITFLLAGVLAVIISNLESSKLEQQQKKNRFRGSISYDYDYYGDVPNIPIFHEKFHIEPIDSKLSLSEEEKNNFESLENVFNYSEASVVNNEESTYNSTEDLHKEEFQIEEIDDEPFIDGVDQDGNPIFHADVPSVHFESLTTISDDFSSDWNDDMEEFSGVSDDSVAGYAMASPDEIFDIPFEAFDFIFNSSLSNSPSQSPSIKSNVKNEETTTVNLRKSQS